jgi:hypothetical protein
MMVFAGRPSFMCAGFGGSTSSAHSFFEFDFAADTVIALSNADVNRDPSIKNGAT